jgi:ribosomal protein S7
MDIKIKKDIKNLKEFDILIAPLVTWVKRVADKRTVRSEYDVYRNDWTGIEKTELVLADRSNYNSEQAWEAYKINAEWEHLGKEEWAECTIPDTTSPYGHYFHKYLEKRLTLCGKRSKAKKISQLCRNNLSMLHRISNPYLNIEISLRELLPLIHAKKISKSRISKQEEPCPLKINQSTSMVCKWIVDGTKKNNKNSKNKIASNLSSELVDVFNEKNTLALQKRDELYNELYYIYRIKGEDEENLKKETSSQNNSKKKKTK